MVKNFMRSGRIDGEIGERPLRPQLGAPQTGLSSKPRRTDREAEVEAKPALAQLSSFG